MASTTAGLPLGSEGFRRGIRLDHGRAQLGAAALVAQSSEDDALGAGPGKSRFSDPMLDRGQMPRWLPIYLGETFTLCLQETRLRDRANAALPGPFLVAEAELALWD